jgi:hypothetical protein
MNIPYLRFGVGLVLGLSLAGCGLISSDVSNFDLTLPDKKFTIDASGWAVDQAAADMVLSTSCAGVPTICSSAAEAACATGCSGTCNASQTCDLSLDISRAQPVNLLVEKPELQSINDQPVIKVTIDSVTYSVTANTLSVDTPELTVYVAPISLTKVTRSDPQVKAIGTIAPVPAGTVTSSPQTLVFTPTGRADLVDIMSSFQTPFNVLVGASLVVTAGQLVPSGKLDAVVYIRGHAGL